MSDYCDECGEPFNPADFTQKECAGSEIGGTAIWECGNDDCDGTVTIDW